MLKKLKLIPTAEMTDKDWLGYRSNGIGGSEIGVILGLSKWKSNVQLFYEKLGDIQDFVQNEATFWGTESEALIAENWQYYDPNDKDPLNYIQNKIDGRLIRKCRRLNAYINNPDIPWAFASLDRIITKGSLEKEGILECKTIHSFASAQWIEGIPPYHLAQLQHYLMVTELDYGELAVLKDGRFFEIITFERNEEFISYIKESASAFWDLVTRARILKQEGKPYEQLEPHWNNQEAYKDFLSERYKSEAKVIAPNAHYFGLAEKALAIGETVKELNEEKTGYENEIKNYMKESDTMDFGPVSGKITWKEQKGKVSIDKDKLQEQNPEIYEKYVNISEPFRVLRLGIKTGDKAGKKKEAA